MRTRVLAASAAVAVAALLAGCTSATSPAASPSGSATGRTLALGTVPAVLPDTAVASLAGALPQRSVGPTPVMRLAAGLVPPTNRWFSGLVFGAKPQPVFPFPLSFAQTASGFSAGLPKAAATANTIAGAATRQVALDVGATGAIVSGYDDVSVTLEHRRGGTVVGHTTVAEGSPLVSYRAASAQRVRLNGPVTLDGADRGTVEAAGQRWAVVVRSGTLHGATASLQADGSVVLLPVPAGASSAVVARLMASAPLRSVATTASASSEGQRTTLAYRAASGAATAVVPLPHQGASAATGCTGATYATIYGTVPVCVARTIAFTTPTVDARAELDLSGVSDARKQQLRTQLRKDVATSKPFAADTYFGGKSLYRSAMLLQLARQLGDEASTATLATRLTKELDLWTQPGGCTTRKQECFVYDPKLRTVVGLAQSFGSEQDNDHHFHYGYFLYAAGVVAAKDPALAKRWAPVMDLLAADIASRPAAGDGAGRTFPTGRVYDPYFSHSWASGFSPFADGNNQESSSEAVNAWAGLSQWAAASGDSALGAEAAWLLSGESASALAYWVNPRLSGAQFQGFAHRMVSLNWGGKRDFATWFSPKAAAIIGIQLIPMSPVSTYLASKAGGGPAQIRALVKAAAADGSAGSFTDYLLMYRSLAGKADAAVALRIAGTLPPAAVDDGDSRTYLLAYLMANAA
jgi:endo-1,3(4)-beta-glucanase